MKKTKLVLVMAVWSSLVTASQAGLLSYYSFEDHTLDVAGNYQNSASTNADDLSIVIDRAGGTVSFASGMVGRCVNLSGGYLTAPNGEVDDLDLSNTFTMEMWINPVGVSTSNWRRLVLNWGLSGDKAYHWAIHNRQLSLYLSNGSQNYEVAIGGQIAESQWQHIAAVADGQSVTLYLNGQSVATGNIIGNINTTSSALLGVGEGPEITQLEPNTFNRYRGLMDELAIWNEALSAQQIAAHYAAGPNGYGLTPIPEPSNIVILVTGLITTLGLVLYKNQIKEKN